MARALGVAFVGAMGLAGASEPTGFGSVELVVETELPLGGTGPRGWTLNEVSAIDYVPGRSALFAMSDDRSENGPARIAEIEVRFDGGVPHFGKLKWHALRTPGGAAFKRDTIDPEALRVVEYEHNVPVVVVASEGFARESITSSLFKMKLDGSSSTEWLAPHQFMRDPGQGPHGISHNRGFESLAIDPGRNNVRFYTTSEEPLRQDEPVRWTPEDPGILRVVEYSNGQPYVQYGFPLGPASDDETPMTQALAELVTVAPRVMLALENAKGDDGKGRARLSWTTVDGATDIRSIRSLRESDLDGHHLMPKVPLVDFEDLGLSSNADDWEGMTLGPMIGGRRSLLVCEDNGGEGPNRLIVLLLPVGIEG
ncbi:MAG: esterase-like activity of phytase family protein [Planctomycetota bacterium]